MDNEALVPLAKASSDLSLILQRLTEVDDVDAVLRDVFLDAIDNEGQLVSGSVDRRIYFLNRAAKDIEYCTDQIAKWTKAKKTMSNIVARLEAHTKSLMEAFPDVKFKGQDGAFKIVKNGGAQKLTIDFETMEKTLRHIIMIQQSEVIPQKFKTLERFEVLNTLAIRTALENGEAVDFAHLEPRGERLSY